MKTKVITSFNSNLWEKYAKVCMGSWVEHLKLDEGSIIEVWINGPFPQGLPMKTSGGLEFHYKSLDVQSEGWRYFYENFGNHARPETPQGQEYKFNFLPFSCKVYALAETSWAIKDNGSNADEKGTRRGGDFDTLAWIDADVKLVQDVNASYLSQVLGNAHFAWLDRGRPWGHGETGFMLMKISDLALDLFLHQANIYGSGQLFYFAEWHDAFILSSCVRYKQFTDNDQFIVKNLNTDMNSEHKNGLYPFETSILNSHMEHYKGNLKNDVNK